MIHLSEEQIASIVEKAEASLLQNIVSSTQSAIESRVRWALDEQIGATVAAFFKAELQPKLVKELNDQRDVMAQKIVAAAISIGSALADKLVEKAQKNLASEYNSGKILEELFKR